MRGLGLGLGLTRRATSTFTPSSLTLTAWFDPSDLTTLYQSGSRASPGTAVAADGDPVGLMLDKSGNNFDFTQSTAGNKPLYKIDGNGKPYLLFDGTDDFLSVSLAPTLPFDRLTAMQQVSWTVNDIAWVNSGGGFGRLRQASASPNIQIFDGGASGLLDSDLAVGSNGVVTERHIAGASKLAANNSAYVSGDAGSAAPTGTMTLGAAAAGANAGNIRFYGAVIKQGTLSDTDIANLRTWLGAKCSVTL